MSIQQKLKHELKAVAVVSLYFVVWLGSLMVIKVLILEEYHIEYRKFSMVLVGALILAKVVLVLEHVPLGERLRARPAWVHVLFRTVLYSLGVLVVMLLEKGFEGRHEYGGFALSLKSVFQHADIYHVWANTICVSGALLGYNVLSVVRRHLGEGQLVQLFLSPLPSD